MTQDEYKTLLDELNNLPKGTITKKKISNVNRYYLQWRNNDKKTRSKYVKLSELEIYKTQIARRKEIEIAIKEYKRANKDLFKPSSKKDFKTNVKLGDELLLKCDEIKNYKHRYSYDYLKRYLDIYSSKIIAMYGLRRTGKTTMLFQAINYIGIDKSAYIKIKPTDRMQDLSNDLDILNEKNIKYVFIDEITLMRDFIQEASILSDYYATFGMKIVLSGTDSLSFLLATNQELYDRCYLLHTSYISYGEYAYLLDIHNIDTYIEYGGLLKKENANIDDVFTDEMSFNDDESTRKYIDTAISRNIQNSLKNDIISSNYKYLHELYENDKLVGIINRLVENMNHSFVADVINTDFVSHDFGSLAELLHKNNNYEIDNIDKEKLIERFKKLLNIKEVDINEEHLNELKDYLYKLDLIIDLKTRMSNGDVFNNISFIQPGIRYSQAKSLVYLLNEDDYFKSLNAFIKESIISTLLNDIKGRMLEDIIHVAILKNCIKSYKSKYDYYVFKYKFIKNGEYDIVEVDRKRLTVNLYEIKHSNKINKNQIKYLNDDNMINAIEYSFGKVINKYVLYRGKDKIVDDIHYLNIESFLQNM